MRVQLRTEPEFSASAPELVCGLSELGFGSSLEAGPDDAHLTFVQLEEGERGVTTFNVVENWFAELKSKAPMPGK